MMNKKIINNLKKTKELHQSFTKEIKKKIPVAFVGIIVKKDGSPRFLEIVIKRPERYTCPTLIKQVPKLYKGVKVKTF